MDWIYKIPGIQSMEEKPNSNVNEADLVNIVQFDQFGIPNYLKVNYCVVKGIGEVNSPKYPLISARTWKRSFCDKLFNCKIDESGDTDSEGYESEKEYPKPAKIPKLESVKHELQLWIHTKINYSINIYNILLMERFHRSPSLSPNEKTIIIFAMMISLTY